MASLLYITLLIIGDSEHACQLRGSSFHMIHKEWFMSRNTRIMCWNIDRERRKCGPDAAGVRRFILPDVALSKSMESSKAGIKSSQNDRTYRTDDGCYEFGKHQTRGERWLNGDRKDHTFMRGSGVTGISPGWSRQAPQDIYDVRINKSFVSSCIFLLYISVHITRAMSRLL